jgi:hypothetical protein
VCGRNLITGLKSAASPTVDISSTCNVRQKLGVSLPLLTCSPSAWPSRLLYRRGRKSLRELWITPYTRFSVIRASHAAACRTTLLTIAAFTKVGSRDYKRFPPLTTGLEAQTEVRVSQINIYRCSQCFRYTTNCLSNCWCKHFVHPHLQGQVASLFLNRPSLTYLCLQFMWIQQNKIYIGIFLLFNLYYDQQMHNYITNYHTPTCFDTIVSSSGSLYLIPCQVTHFKCSCW